MRKILMATTFIMGAMSVVSPTHAYVFSKSATVKIVTPLTMDTTTDLNFGIVEKPSGIKTVTVATNGAASGTATLLGGTVQAGSYTVIGDSIDTISLTVSATSTVDGLTLDSFTTKYNGTNFTNGSIVAAPGTGKALDIGATLTINGTTVASGTLNPGYNIAVLYQ